ncbi:hypothetical protein NQ176_g1155 [Zarea fungicola]|uniref:Uncharacterized protein n=1 Tax=Zarea fungicola TaxID=93591 RepID=A0ACC1NVB4_9HYPO|nr:hypothetical protein NQ176_g1155 [Lecanicillium fungicola]
MSPHQSSDIIPAIRTSCDRCHLQKLKCSVPSSTDSPSTQRSCTRCDRAKVPCTFGRRSRPKRSAWAGAASSPAVAKKSREAAKTGSPNDLDASRATRSGEEQTITEAYRGGNHGDDQDTTTSDVAASTSSSENFTFDPNWMVHDAISTEMVPEPLQEAQARGVGDMYTFQGSEPVFLNVEHLLDQGGGTPHSFGITFPPTARSDDNNNNSTGDGPIEFHQQASIQPGQCLTTAAAATSTTTTTTTRMLLSLASDLEDHLESMEDMPHQRWGACDHDCIDRYPIGRVVHLSQKFASLAKELQRARSEDSGGLEQQPQDFPSWSRPRISTGLLTPSSLLSDSGSYSSSCTNTAATQLPSPETPGILILLSCYLTLIRIYVIVLDHFQHHLESSGRRAAQTVNLAPTMCLGELPSSNTSYNQIYEGSCIMLNALREAVEAFGIRCNVKLSSSAAAWAGVSFSDALVGQQMTQSARDIYRGYAEIEARVASIKDWIRQQLEF